MAKYRKKPVVIEAIRIRETYELFTGGELNER